MIYSGADPGDVGGPPPPDKKGIEKVTINSGENVDS